MLTSHRQEIGHNEKKKKIQFLHFKTKFEFQQLDFYGVIFYN